MGRLLAGPGEISLAHCGDCHAITRWSLQPMLPPARTSPRPWASASTAKQAPVSCLICGKERHQTGPAGGSLVDQAGRGRPPEGGYFQAAPSAGVDLPLEVRRFRFSIISNRIEITHETVGPDPQRSPVSVQPLAYNRVIPGQVGGAAPSRKEVLVTSCHGA